MQRFRHLTLAFARLLTLLAVQALLGSAAVAQTAGVSYRLQLNHGGQFLDADHCGSPVALNPGSGFDGGACQLWRLVPASVRID